MRAETQTGGRTKDEAEDAALVEALFSALPSFTLLAIRATRAAALFGLTLLLVRSIPTIEARWTLAICVAVLSLFNMTKWVAATAMAALLIVAVVPPQAIALVLAR